MINKILLEMNEKLKSVECKDSINEIKFWINRINILLENNKINEFSNNFHSIDTEIDLVVTVKGEIVPYRKAKTDDFVDKCYDSEGGYTENIKVMINDIIDITNYIPVNKLIELENELVDDKLS